MQLILKIILIFLMILFIDDYATAQTSVPIDTNMGKIDTSNRSISQSTKDSLWLLASFSGVATFQSAPEGVDFGATYKFGVVWHNQIFQFDYLFNGSRNDYALLYGNSHRSSDIFSNAAVGISLINYTRYLSPIISPNSSHGFDTIVNSFSGSTIGLDAMIEAYITPISYWGVIGFGLYGCLARGNSMIALEISAVFELNLPIPLK
jgi:hypothetical protein